MAEGFVKITCHVRDMWWQPPYGLIVYMRLTLKGREDAPWYMSVSLPCEESEVMKTAQWFIDRWPEFFSDGME